jgi:hypothetical protein
MATVDSEPPPADTGQLISGVLSDARDLATAEVDKLKAEAITQVKEVGEEVKVISVGLLILTVAAVMLATAISLGIAALGLPPWLGFLIVAVACGVTGVLFLKLRPRAAEHATERVA